MSIAQLQSTSDAVGFLELLILTSSAWSSSVRIVADTRDWTIGSDSYIALPFRLKLPSQVAGENPLAQIEIDNVGRAFSAELEALGPRDTSWAEIRIVSRAAPTTSIYSFVGALSGVQVSVASLSAQFGDDITMRQGTVRHRYDPTRTPGIFPG